MMPFVDNAELAKHARYWRGFALWRRALNALGQGGSPDSTDADFARANEEFRHALRLDSAYAEAKIGLVAGLSNRVFFNQENSALRMVEAALARLAPSRADTIEAALEPTWGGPELHMLLATLLVRSRTQLDKAQRHAERALVLRPNWLAVRRNLIPAIHALRAPGS
jgi:hypothetical protein